MSGELPTLGFGLFVTDSVGYAHLLGDGHNRIHYRRSWRLLINVAVVVLLLSCAFTNSSLAEERADAANRYFKLGRESNDKGQYQKAIGYFETSLNIVLDAFGEKHSNVARVYNNLGFAWNGLGQYQKAIGYFEKALAINREGLGEQHPEVAATYNNLGLAWNGLGQYQKANGFFEKALTINREDLGEQHPDAAFELPKRPTSGRETKMEWLINNPIANMFGPYFLVLYAIVILLILAGAWMSTHQHDPTAKLPPLAIPLNPDPYEIAYLRGGENEVTRVVMFALVQRGYLETPEQSWWESKTSDQKLSRKQTHPDPRHLSPIEKTVFSSFATPTAPKEIFQSSLPDTVKSHCAQYEHKFRDEQLLCPKEIKKTALWFCLIGGLIIAGLGGYKVIVALAKAFTNVFFLIAMGVVGIVILVINFTSLRLSRRGKNYLEQLEKAFEKLKETGIYKRTATQSELSLAVGIFGVSVLAGTSYAFFEEMFHQGAGAGFFGGGCGGGCGGGGGGGGGCGGCGGGGGS